MKSRNRANGRRGGRSNPVLVRESSYSLPIVEPANFMEVDVDLGDLNIDSSGGNSAFAVLTYGDIGLAINHALKVNIAPVEGQVIFSCQKFRVCSAVIDPVTMVSLTSASGGMVQAIGTNINVDVQMGASGNHYQFASSDKPLRMRFSKLQGNDGEWKRGFGVSGAAGGLVTVSGTNGYGASISSLSQFLVIIVDNPLGTDLGIDSLRFFGKIHLRLSYTDDYEGPGV